MMKGPKSARVKMFIWVGLESLGEDLQHNRKTLQLTSLKKGKKFSCTW